MRQEIRDRIDKINQGIVPEGYKETKLGILPEEWHVNSVSKIFNISGGKSYSRRKMGDIGIPCLHYGDIHSRNKLEIDEYEIDKFPKVDVKKSELKRKIFLEDGDLVFADASEDYQDIGKSVLINNENNIPFIAGLHTIIAKDKNNTYNNQYKRYLFQIHNIKKEIKYYTSGTSVLGISRKNIKKVKVFYPTLREQKNIANILSTWDKAIELKENLLEKKKDIKKGLMQRLLTGEIRLEGFDDGWEIFYLNKLAKIYQPKTIAQYEMTESGFPVYGANGKIGFYKDFNHKLKQIIITCRGSTCGTVNYSDEKSWITGNAMVINVDKNPKIDKLFLYFKLLNTRFASIITGSGQPQITGKAFKGFKVKIPVSINEQKAIADILSKADKSIELLEKEIESLKKQKKGLMQLLLTGKVRVNELSEEILSQIN